MAYSTARVQAILERNSTVVAPTWTPAPLLQPMLDQARQSHGLSTIVLACADPRFPPEKFLGLQGPEAAVIRNAGGRADEDVIRSLLALNALVPAGLVLVVHHTDCGMSHLEDEEVKMKTADFQGGLGKEERAKLEGMRFGIIGKGVEGAEKSVREDVKVLREHGIFGKSGATIVGLLLDAESGLLRQIDQ